MFEELVGMVNDIAKRDIKAELPFRAAVMFRNGMIVQGGLDPALASKLAIQTKFVFGSEYSDEELHLVIDPMVTTVTNMITAFSDEGFHTESLALIGQSLDLELALP